MLNESYESHRNRVLWNIKGNDAEFEFLRWVYMLALTGLNEQVSTIDEFKT